MSSAAARQDPATGARGDAPPPSLRRLVQDTRTPLNAIQGFAELLLAGAGGPLSAVALDYLGQIAEAARLLDQAVQAFAVADMAEAEPVAGAKTVSGPCGSCTTRHPSPDEEG